MLSLKCRICILSEVSQTEKTNDITYVRHLKDNANEFIYKTETDSQYIENKFMVTKRKVGGGINEEYGTNRYTLLYIKQVSNKDLQYSTGNYIQYLVIAYNGS